MIEITTYKCEICGQVHNKKETMKMHEAVHRNIKEIVKLEYLDNGSNAAPYPHQITIKMSDDTVHVYDHVCQASRKSSPSNKTTDSSFHGYYGKDR